MLKNHGGNSAMSKASTWMVEFPLPRLKPEARTGDRTEMQLEAGKARDSIVRSCRIFGGVYASLTQEAAAGQDK